MSSLRLSARVPSARAEGIARLLGHELRFHKVSNKDGSAKCDVFYTGDDSHVVTGVVFSFHPSQKGELDRAEGLGYGYEAKSVTLLSEDGREIEAFTYYATSIDPALRPYHWYKEHVVRGAMEHGLPDEYVELLKQIASVADPDRERHEKEMALYR